MCIFFAREDPAHPRQRFILFDHYGDPCSPVTPLIDSMKYVDDACFADKGFIDRPSNVAMFQTMLAVMDDGIPRSTFVLNRLADPPLPRRLLIRKIGLGQVVVIVRKADDVDHEDVIEAFQFDPLTAPHVEARLIQ